MVDKCSTACGMRAVPGGLGHTGGCHFTCSGLTSTACDASAGSGTGLELVGASASAGCFAADCASFSVANVSCIFSIISATLLLLLTPTCCSSRHRLTLVLESIRLLLFLLVGQSLPVLAHRLNPALLMGVSFGLGDA